MFGFRIRFNIEPSRRFSSDTNPIMVEEHGGTLKAVDGPTMADARAFALRMGGFATAAQAEQVGQQWADAVVIAGLRLRTGFDVGRFARHLGGASAYLKQLAREDFAITIRNEVHGLDVFEDSPTTRFASVHGTATGGMQADRLVAALRASVPAAPLAPKLRLALDLFGLAPFEPSPRVRFLTLISAIEVLSTRAPSSAGALVLVESWEKALASADAEVRDVLASRLRELRRESIGVACRRLVREHVGEAAVKDLRRLYDVRSTLVHDGEVPGEDFGAVAQRATDLTALVLESLVSKIVPPLAAT